MQPETQSARSRRSYGKIEDCEQSTSRYIKRQKDSLPLDVHRPETQLLELLSNCITSLPGRGGDVKPLSQLSLVDQWTFTAILLSATLNYICLH